MILGFKHRFVPIIEAGSKTHTIRGGQRWKVGMRADLYAHPRQKNMRLIFRAPVIQVEIIEFWDTGLERPLHERVAVYRNGKVLDGDQRNDLAYRDGFQNDPELARIGILNGCFAQMVQFWASTHGLGHRTNKWFGQIVHWDYSARFMDLKAQCGLAR